MHVSVTQTTVDRTDMGLDCEVGALSQNNSPAAGQICLMLGQLGWSWPKTIHSLVISFNREVINCARNCIKIQN
jgi:hypothetical protein